MLAGLSNAYADYITTFEEYQNQRYEAGSTIYGPHTLSAYINIFNKLATAMVQVRMIEIPIIITFGSGNYFPVYSIGV